MKLLTIFILTSSCAIFTSCGHLSNHNSDSLKCIILGYDSIIYYSGTSSEMQGIKKGKITDTAFISGMFQALKDRNLELVLKPGGGANMIPNYREITRLANNHEIIHPSVDTIDDNEEKAFHTSTPPPVKEAMHWQEPPTQAKSLFLPKDSDKTDISKKYSNIPKESLFIIILFNNSGIYAYTKGDINKGKLYSNEELSAILKSKISDTGLVVLIKPTKKSTYKNLVDVLDVMTQTDVKRYALVDLTKEEEDFIPQFQQ